MAGGSFQSRTKLRLAQYKRDVLNVHEDGLWLKNRRPYAHILPIAERQLNILPAFRDQFWAGFDQRDVRLHSDFHHLNSSQALCFNLFFPFLVPGGSGLTAIVKALGLTGTPLEAAAFEFEPDSAEGTNFDFMIPLQAGNRIYFEVKFTEADFGSADADDEHLQKFRDVYLSRTAGRFEPEFCTAKGFLKHYQIVRNLWHLDLDSHDTAVFLIPRANRGLVRGLGIIRSCLVEPHRPKAVIVYTEDLVSRLLADTESTCESQRHALSEFCIKYFPDLKHQSE
jgi:hypothetical protein